MKVQFIGGAFLREMEKDIMENSRGVVHYAANKFQWNLIDGLLKIKGIELEILSAPFIGPYPKEYKNLYIKKQIGIYKDLVPYKAVPFCNAWGVRNISRSIALKKEIQDFSLARGEKKIIFVYSPHTPFLEAAVHAKKKDPSIHICLIVPDLPQYMNLNEKKSIIYNKLKEIDIQLFTKNARYVDSFVLLTEHMKDILNVGIRPYVVVEGMVNTNEMGDDERIESEQEDVPKSIVYTGTLNKKFGVVNLVKAFHTIKDPNVNLVICGRGDSESVIKEYASKDERIQFLSQISNQEATVIQRKATILVNPRQNNEEYTRYSFPSKNMEYLLSGKPVIAYKLDGIPNEYDNYFYYVENDSIESLRDKLQEVLNLSKQERYDFGKQAKEFVLNKKNNYQMTLKIISMIKNNLK